ncbi:MAG: phytoene/squalene synthase family protein [Bacteroidetes bacterium]|nr:phytoene/squalene synthase family protein [Bacteroidota bacterium]
MFTLYEKTAADCSRMITENYSTSFSLGIRMLHKNFREPVYNIYALVRYADEIVDSFHAYDKRNLLSKFKQETFEAIESGISMNPVIYSFQKTVNKYQIPLDLIQAFFKSMETDLSQNIHEKESYEAYIYGSAEVVGLMCLRVFADGDEVLFNQLKTPARALGAAFQKVNFLRDIKNDHDELGRIYFPGVDFKDLQKEAKHKIEEEILQDFNRALTGILLLPIGSRVGVKLAYNYYIKLFERIRKVPPAQIQNTRIRVPDIQKALIFVSTFLQQKMDDFWLSPSPTLS